MVWKKKTFMIDDSIFDLYFYHRVPKYKILHCFNSSVCIVYTVPYDGIQCNHPRFMTWFFGITFPLFCLHYIIFSVFLNFFCILHVEKSHFWHIVLWDVTNTKICIVKTTDRMKGRCSTPKDSSCSPFITPLP